MKRFFFLATVVLLAMAILSTGCATKAPAAKAPTSNLTGILKGINTPAEPGRDVVAVETPQGLKTFPITPNTKYTLDGRACPLDDVGQALDAGNGTYVCTVIYDYDNADGEARAIYVTKEKSVTGILKDINTPAEPGRDVVTVETPQGPRTFPVTPDTIITLKGQAGALCGQRRLTCRPN